MKESTLAKFELASFELSREFNVGFKYSISLAQTLIELPESSS